MLIVVELNPSLDLLSMAGLARSENPLGAARPTQSLVFQVKKDGKPEKAVTQRTLPSGLRYEVLQRGTGPQAQAGKKAMKGVHGPSHVSCGARQPHVLSTVLTPARVPVVIGIECKAPWIKEG